MSRVLLQGHELLRLGARYWLGAPNSWDTTGHPQVLGHSIGEPVHPIFYRVHQTILPSSTNPDRNPDGSKDRPHISPSTGYYRSPENKNRNHHIQFKKNNNLWNKMIERTYHEVLNAIVNELLHPLLVVFTLYVRLYKQLHWTRLTSKRRSL